MVHLWWEVWEVNRAKTRAIEKPNIVAVFNNKVAFIVRFSFLLYILLLS